MKIKVLLLISIFCWTINSTAQVNLTLRDSLSYSETRLNDIWGWHDATTGNEYALVGARTGTSIVDVTNPDDIQEMAFLPGAESVWRDLKTWGEYAYVTNETANGLEVIHLGNLPIDGTVTSTTWEPIFPNGDTLQTCHNLYIDEFGYCYLSGCNTINGGVIIVDVFSMPGQPQFVAFGQDTYSHDAYARDNILYSSEIGEGTFTLFDVSDKQNIIELGSSPTVFNTTHNAWLSDDSNVLFTTDEKADATIGAYEISDPTDIEALDQFRPLATIGTGVVPHNVHVLDDYIVASHYSDGGIIIDASEPDNLIEVGSYDTYLGEGQGFQGCWGAYPFLPSGNILLSSIGEGLFVLTPNYQRACRLQGTVSDAANGSPIAFATAIINAPQQNTSTTDFTGEYRTGIVMSGIYEVTYDAPGYNSKTLTVTLENGIITMQDVELEESARYNLTGIVVRAEDGTPIPFGQVYLDDGFFDYSTTADAAGVFTFDQIFEEDYQAVAGAWGFEYAFTAFSLNNDSNIQIEMEAGYQDDFLFDLDWETSTVGNEGLWERAEPVGTFFELRKANPSSDLVSDYGTFCYITGNGGEPANTDDVDEQTVTLTSPPMDLTIYENPFIRYQAWFFNRGANDSQGDDELQIRLSNGTEEVTLQTIGASNSFWRSPTGYNVQDLLSLTDNMRLIIETTDTGEAHITEAGFDAFRVTEGNSLNLEPLSEDAFILEMFPNPFRSFIGINYQIPAIYEQAEINIFNQIGQQIFSQELNTPEGKIVGGTEWRAGYYFVQLVVNGKIVKTEKIMKF